MEMNKDAPSVVRRRRKINRMQREQTPEGAKLGHFDKYSDEESSSATDQQHLYQRSPLKPSPSPGAHRSKILNRRDKNVATTSSRSQSTPRVVEPLENTPDTLSLMRTTKRSLSSPRQKDESSDSGTASPSGTLNRNAAKGPRPETATVNGRDDVNNLTKLEINLKRFEEERKRFEMEKRKFEKEKRDLDKLRIRKLEEFDRKRLAEGHSNMKALEPRRSLIPSDADEKQSLIESFNKAQQMYLKKNPPSKVTAPERRNSSLSPEPPLRRKSSLSPAPPLIRKSPSKPIEKAKTSSAELSATVEIRRTASFKEPKRKSSLNAADYESSTASCSSSEEYADDEYTIERKSSKASINGKESVPLLPKKTHSKLKTKPKPEVTEEKQSWLSKLFKKKTKPTSKKDDDLDLKSRGKDFKIDAISKGKITPTTKILQESNWQLWKKFKAEHVKEVEDIKLLRNKCIANLIILIILCGCGGIVFRYVEGAFENFYKCGVKRVKRDFIDQLWLSSHNLREDDWKSLARTRLRKFEEELHAAHEAGMTSYSGQKSWSFLNGWVYCLSIVTTIGYGHIAPKTTLGQIITIVYAIIGIPIFLILLADFGKLFTRGIKFLWAYVRRVYYTGSCRKVRKQAQVQGMMRGINMAYEIATFRRPSMFAKPETDEEDSSAPSEQQQQPQQPFPSSPHSGVVHLTPPQTDVGTPQTPMPSEMEIDDEFNLPISLAFALLIAYIIIGATIYHMWERWTFFESFYFVFISMSTIGFGDFVPNHPMFMMASIVYLVFGLALTSMCINVVQVKLSDSFKQASAKIGATIGLKMAEAEAEAAQNSEIGTPVELASVHSTTPKVNFSPPTPPIRIITNNLHNDINRNNDDDEDYDIDDGKREKKDSKKNSKK